MTAKNINPIVHLKDKNASRLVEALYEINHLKQLFRKGWLRNISPEKCESVAEHTFGMAMMAWLLADEFFPELNREKVLKLSLIHDIAEVYAGDTTPYDRLTPEEKNAREREALTKIFSGLPNGDSYISLWEEFENGSSAEAKFVKQIDRLEMALQAAVYEHQQGLELEEFFDSAAQSIHTPALKDLLDEIRKSRKNRVNG